MQDTTPRNASAGVEARYQASLDAGRFQIQRCNDCRQHVFFPRQICPHCGSINLDWIAPSGSGTVYSTSVVRRKPEAGGEYNVALIDLDEQVRMMSRVEGIAPAEVKIGMRVQAQVIQIEGRGVVVFDLAGGAGSAARGTPAPAARSTP